jgi:hypothetical protein
MGGFLKAAHTGIELKTTAKSETGTDNVNDPNASAYAPAIKPRPIRSAGAMADKNAMDIGHQIQAKWANRWPDHGIGGSRPSAATSHKTTAMAEIT